jgi:hypothetical protein
MARRCADDPPTMTDPVELSYNLHLVPPGQVPFRRWRWELWHGPQLLAAGWRVSTLHAQRALRTHASRYAHRVNGLHVLHPDAARAPESVWHGNPVTIDYGAVRVVLTARALRDWPKAA